MIRVANKKWGAHPVISPSTVQHKSSYCRGEMKDPSQRLLWTLVFGLLVLAAGEFLLRGPVRFARAKDFNDFLSPYIQTRAWAKGADPYSPANLVALWPTDAQRADFLTTDLADGSLVRKRGIPTAYPPTVFPLLASVAWLPWHFAHKVWLALSLLAFGATVFSLVSLNKLNWRQQQTYIFLALALALAPFHTALATGSIVIVAVGFCALAVLASDRQWNIAAGLFCGLAAALKPQIGLPFIFYYLLRRRWGVVLSSAALLVILAGIAVSHLAIDHTPWIDNYKYDNQLLFARGSLGDFTESDPIRFSLVNLQVLLYTFVPDRMTANVVALLITSVLGLLWLWLLLLNRHPGTHDQLLELATLAVLSLLPVYHRLYDTSLLIFPLAWCLVELRRIHKRLAKEVLLLVLVFLVPGGSALEQLQHTSHLVALQHSWFWAHIVMPHQVWVLLFLSGLLLAAMRKNLRDDQRSTTRTDAASSSSTLATR